MAKPVGVVSSKTKDNSRKKHRENEEFNKGKKLDRPKQVWVVEEPLAVPAGEQPNGHWEKA
jgi:hypothetical protein